MGFVGSLPGFLAVKEFWQSVKNWQSYRREFGVLLLWGHCDSEGHGLGSSPMWSWVWTVWL